MTRDYMLAFKGWQCCVFGGLSMYGRYFIPLRVAASRRPVCQNVQGKWSRHIAATLLGVVLLSSVANALELPKPEPVDKYLGKAATGRSEEHTSELQSHSDLVC